MKMTTDTWPLEEMFRQISEKEFYSPLIRDIKSQDSFDPDSYIIDVETWTAQFQNRHSDQISELEFVSCMNYTSERFLFHYNNKFDAPDALIQVVENHFRKEIIQKLKSIALGDTSDLERSTLQPVFDLLIQHGYASEIDSHFTENLKSFDWKFYPQALKTKEQKSLIKKAETLLNFIGETLPYLQSMSEKI